METILHPIEPVYDTRSRILMLGSFPSPKSREYGFYYGHPQNRFWKVLSRILEEEPPRSNEEKRRLLLRHHIALWDVLHSCKIKGAADDSILDPVPNDMGRILGAADIRAVFTTGGAATRLFRRLCTPQCGIEPIPLPSTSPANCRHYDLERLVEAYRVILEYLK